jgi:hypothetical protein
MDGRKTSIKRRLGEWETLPPTDVAAPAPAKARGIRSRVSGDGASSSGSAPAAPAPPNGGLGTA